MHCISCSRRSDIRYIRMRVSCGSEAILRECDVAKISNCCAYTTVSAPYKKQQ